MSDGRSHVTARKLAAVPQSAPSEDQRARWRLRSSRRRKREDAGERVYRISLPESLVAGALMASAQGDSDLASHEICEERLAELVDRHLRRVIDETTDSGLKLDINRLLRDFDR